MTAEYTNLIHIPGLLARVVVDGDYDWWALGELLADGYDYEQGNFLTAFAESLKARPGSDGLMQIQYLADLFNDNDWNKEAVIWFLRELLIRLENDDG